MLKEVFASILAGAISIPFFILAIKISNEIKANKEKKERLYFSEKRLHCIALKFRDDCIAETKKLISKYTVVISQRSYRHLPDYLTFSFISDYNKKIECLKKEYFTDYAMKYSEGDNLLRIEAEDLPNFILEEYKKELSDIAASFHNLSDYMRQEIEKNEKEYINQLSKNYAENEIISVNEGAYEE